MKKLEEMLFKRFFNEIESVESNNLQFSPQISPKENFPTKMFAKKKFATFETIFTLISTLSSVHSASNASVNCNWFNTHFLEDHSSEETNLC